MTDEKIDFINDSLYFYTAIGLIQAAQKEILICNFKMEHPIGRKKQKLIALYHALEKKATAGVSIKILLHGLAGKNTIAQANRTTAVFLKKQGAQIRSLPNWRTIHAKILIQDEKKMLLGSHNWTARSLSYNLETSLLIKNSHTIDQVTGFFLTAWEEAQPF